MSYCSLDDCKLYFSSKGQGETVILLHGALADKRMWNAYIELLSKHYHVIALSQRHFGESLSKNSMFGINTHANDLIYFIEKMNFKKVHVVAWSYGADVALNAAILKEELFSSLFLYELGYPCCLNNQEQREFQDDAIEWLKDVFGYVEKNDTNSAVRSLINGSAQLENYFDSQKEDMKKQQLDNANTLYLQLKQNEHPDMSAEKLSKISIPITLAFGQDTRKLFWLVNSCAKKVLSHCDAISIEKANHILPLDNVNRFYDLIKNHLEKNKI